jgi:APA family basic amino acid/polyamine antiporter
LRKAKPGLMANLGDHDAASSLRRALGLVDAVGVGVGAMIGAGLFVVTGVAAGVAGPAMLVSLLIAGAGAACNALSSADLAANFPRAGGTYEYATRVLNPWLGFAAGWMFLASKLAAGGTVALGFGVYAARLFPSLEPRATGVVAVVLLVMANLCGIRRAGAVNLMIVAVTIAALLYFIVSLVPSFDSQRLQPFAPGGVLSVLEAAAVLFFAYTGYARIATLGEEVVSPERNIPRAVIWSVGITSVLYFVVCLVCLGTIGAREMAETNAPLEAAARVANLPAAGAVIVVAGCSAMLGVLLSQVLGVSRMMFAMARGGDLPAVLKRTNSHDIPYWAVLTTGGFLLAVALFGRLEFVAAGASFTILLYYGITNAAALRLPAKRRRFPRWVAWSGLSFCVVMAASLDFKVIASGVGLLALGLLGRWTLRGLARRSV